MRFADRHYRDEWLPNYYPSRSLGQHRVRISRTGKTQILTAEEDAQLDEIFMDPTLFGRLQRTGHILTEQNAQRVLADLKTWHLKTYMGPYLHIVVLTRRCNLNCTYCHMNPVAVGHPEAQADLQPDVAEAVIRFAFSSPSPYIKFEFQGGEPFLNFAGMRHFVQRAQRYNEEVGKQLSFTVVSNLMVATDQQLEFCRDNHISVAYTLNGPQDIHDYFRSSRNGRGSYERVVRRMREVNERFPGLLSSGPLCVVTQDNAAELRRMIDFYHDAGFPSLAIIALKHLGNAVTNRLMFDVREFLHYYLAALDYIYDKNRELKEAYSERSMRVVLAKIFGASDVGYVDWRNPCGDVSGALTYDYDGEILPSDEARSLRHVFGLGNVRDLSYEQLMRRKSTFMTMNLSLRDRDPICRECPYNPYCGVSPVLDYGRTRDASPRPHESDECLFTIAVLDWAFRKLMEDPLPLMRMLPDFDAHAWELLPEPTGQPAESLALGGASRGGGP
ncbi:MAG: radical SAM protein [Actinomycetota bacterium]|nr:radical SAM protein [Actinomycetota bacterium]